MLILCFEHIWYVTMQNIYVQLLLFRSFFLQTFREFLLMLAQFCGFFLIAVNLPYFLLLLFFLI